MAENKTYKTGQLAEFLGVSRDALRYYEEKGIIKPRQRSDNGYREFDFYDIYTLLVTDFYKKRNLSINEVKKLQTGSEISELELLLQHKAQELEEGIRSMESMLQRINETKAFCKELQEHINTYSIRELPTFEILGEFSDFSEVSEYPLILERVDPARDDILSKLMREFTFDNQGILTSKMYIVNKGNQATTGTCIYTIIEDGRSKNDENDPKLKVFHSLLEWAREQEIELLGVAYVYTRLIAYHDQEEKIYLEVFVPMKENKY